VSFVPTNPFACLIFSCSFHTRYAELSSWPQAPVPASTYQTNSFARSVFQRTAPASAYPTPPPPGIITSSSSLAFALGHPISSSARPACKADTSTEFFDDFLARKSRELVPSAGPAIVRPSTPKRQAEAFPQESPDPLALLPSTPRPYATPRKRKLVVEIESPSMKRLNSMQSLTIGQSPTKMPFTPSKSQPRQTLAYVEVPRLPKEWRTPSSSHAVGDPTGSHSLRRMKVDGTPDDLGGYGSEGYYSPTRSNAKSSGRKTGDRDERGTSKSPGSFLEDLTYAWLAPLEKLTALVEDIFEAEDGLSSDAELQHLPADIFSPLSVDCTKPLLNPNVIRKLCKYTGQVARPTKRLRLSSRDSTAGCGNTPRHKGHMSEVDSSVLSRILKILERSVRAGEDIDPFRSVGAPLAKLGASRKHIKQKSSNKNGHTTGETHEGEHPFGYEDAMAVDVSLPCTESSEPDLDKFSDSLDVARDSILAADCCMALLGSDRLPKQVSSLGFHQTFTRRQLYSFTLRNLSPHVWAP
jgi:cohesin loading factor subunit SCC2